MKSRSRIVCSVGTAFCLGMFVSAVGQAEEPKQNALPPLPGPEIPLPPELQGLAGKDAPMDLPPELQGLAGKDAPLPPDLPPELKVLQEVEAPPLPPELQQLQKMMEQESKPPSPPPAAEKPAAAQAAVMPTYDITFFSHKFHVEGAGFTCADCHDSIFQQTAGSAKAKGDFNMTSFGQGKYCGACHDGSTAFAVTDQDSCVRCHGTDMKPSADLLFEQNLKRLYANRQD